MGAANSAARQLTDDEYCSFAKYRSHFVSSYTAVVDQLLSVNLVPVSVSLTHLFLRPFCCWFIHHAHHP